ncbi:MULTISPECIES: cell envelope integrity protein CreD [Buttiauxella]|uniref:cell envelope integrity protein CreD n=1 Tax=Buttiauxella TaxID=82976 RepID=UPI0010610AA6|nr:MULTISPECIES: cell envelope integrity protein CreD [Buttiauxella]MCE0825757.1 cell envelope integrity protein CreD [Buttiauxella ferragutiae]TDN53114.1 inner membrane protein [Buttiauxella sp. JUb87]
MFKSALFWKVMTLLGCMAVLLIPLSMLSSLINERSSYRDDVEQSLRQSASGPQTLTGPLIAIPVAELTTVMEDNKEVKKERRFIRYYLPENLDIVGKQTVEPRHIGIYEGQIWRTAVTVDATFNRQLLNHDMDENTRFGTPYVVLAVGDSRGIGKVGELEINGKTYPIEPGSNLPGVEQGLHAILPIERLQDEKLTLRFNLDLMGTKQLAVVPIGRNSQFSLTSNWPHPNFMGDFLPRGRTVTETGFTANWQSTWFANNLNANFSDAQLIDVNRLPAFSVTVANPVDQYQLTDRAVKYAILLIGLTFMCFFLLETLTGLRVHPMQYLLVGLSLVMFYLVLLAVSEHTGFNLAWLLASLVCAGINGFYLKAVLNSWKASAMFTLGLLTLDAVLWQLLQSEDSALLLGTGVLFVALSSIMLLTRHIDWYGMGQKVQALATDDAQKDPERFRLWK